ncbi:MAG: 3-dehydroquinate synthase II [Candidatus Thermoplasmatota archaeon]
MTGRIPLWVDLRAIPVNKRLSYLHAIEEVAAERALVAKGDPHVERTGLDPVVVDGHNRLKRLGEGVGKLVVLTDAKAQEKAGKAEGIVVIDAPNWRIIPLENLLAMRMDRPGTLYALARSPDEAALFAEVLQTGVHGVVLAPQSVAAIFETDQRLRAVHNARKPVTVAQAVVNVVLAANGGQAQSLPSSQSPSSPADAAGSASAPTDATESRPFLEPATITKIESGGSGDRVCLDTTSLFREGEGLLVGSTARSFVLVHAETIETEFVRARPFRVNAGAVHMYLYAPESRTRYLSELRAGEPVLAVHPDGIHRVMVLGRAKIERRPHTLVHWQVAGGLTGMAMLQTAETIRLVRPDGKAVSVTDLRAGDQILVHQESAARHTGLPVDGDLEEH